MSAQPGWVKGYVPTADEWNGWWARKLDNTDPALAGGPYLGLGGGTLTGPLILSGDPVNNFGAATKQYVDQHVPSGGGNFLPLTGGTLTGPLTLSGAPTLGLHAATMQFVLDKVGTGGVTSFNTRIGAVVMTSGDVTGALSYNPYDSANPAGYQTAAQVAAAGAALVPSNANIITGLGYTPYNATNPANYQTDVQVASAVGASTSNFIPLTQRGSLNGVATLDATGVVPTLQLPGAVTGTLSYLGGWNASTNTPTLATGGLSGGVAQAAGRYYVVTVGATTVAIDGVTTWVAGDWASSNGTAWQRVQNSTSPYLPLTGGNMTVNSSITLSGDTWQPSIEPDIVWSLRGTGGNIPVMLDQTGVFNVASLSSGALSATTTSLTSLTASAATLTTATINGGTATLTNLSASNATLTAATIANETIADQSMPDLIGAVAGSNGNIVSGYDVITGEFNAVSVNAGALKIAGAPLSLGVPVPSDAIDIRAAPYNAAGDGVRNHGYVTTSGSVLTMVNFTGTLTLTVVDATTAQVTIAGVVWSGWAFQPYHQGKLLYLTAPAGYTIVAPVKKNGYIDGTNILIDTTGLVVTPQASVSGTVTCPAIDTTKPVSGKTLIIEGMGRGIWWQETPSVARMSDTVTPYGTQSWFTKTIASFTAPNSITITGSFPFNWTAQPSTVMWGTDDSQAAVNVGMDVFPLKRRVWFSGDGLYLMPTLAGDNSARPALGTAATGNPGPLINGCLFYGDNSALYAMTVGGQRLPHRISAAWAARYNDSRKTVHGRLSFPRCAQIPAGQVINVLFDGDSLGAFNPQGQVADAMVASRFLAEFIQQNPGKRINFYNVAVGGATWAAIASQQLGYNSSTGNPYKYFTIPKPISGTVKHFAFWSNINQTGVGPPIVPDVVVMFCNAGNDKLSVDAMSLQAVVNQVRSVSHGDAYGPTDFVMQTEHQLYGTFYNSGVSGGTLLPGPMGTCLNEFYNAGINRTTALNMGFGLIDPMPLEDRAAFGYDPTRRAMRLVPQVTLAPTPTVPVSLSEECLDFAMFIGLAGANDAAAWTALGEMQVQISRHAGNRVFLRMGTNGNIWAAASTVGLAVNTVVSCDPASHTITLGAATSYTPNITFRTTWGPQVDCTDGSITFTSGMAGQCIIANTGNYDGAGPGRPQQRNWIKTFLDANDILVHQFPADNNDVPITGGAVLIGGQQFVEQDNRAQPDIVITFPDGTIFNTQVAYGGYVSATQATMVDLPPQVLVGQTVSLFVGRMGMKWFDTGLKPSATLSGYVTLSVIQGVFTLGYIDTPANNAPATYASKTVEKFGAPYNPVIYVKNAQTMTLVNRFVDDDHPIAASTPAWYQRGAITTNADWYAGGTGGHHGPSLRPIILDTFYAHQNLSVN